MYPVYNKLIKLISIFSAIQIKLCNNIMRMIYFASLLSNFLHGVDVKTKMTAHHRSKLRTLNI